MDSAVNTLLQPQKRVFQPMSTTTQTRAAIMTTQEVLAYANISRPTFVKLLRDGKLPRTGKIGKQITVPKAAVDRLLGLIPQEAA
jgi:excisionase family DNA binding protein